jgi:membrane dipeptidase
MKLRSFPPLATVIAATTFAAVIAATTVMADSDKEQFLPRALELATKFIILDTHIDVPYRLRNEMQDISVRTESGDFDYPRAVAGGLDGCFMSIYTPAKLESQRRSKALADSLIDLVEGFAIRWPDKFAVATSPDEVIDLREEGMFALMLGMENGSPLEGDVKNLRYFHARGVRYITLTHSKNNHICDSSYDKTRTWNGLSAFGRLVIKEMNRLGIMIDVSHVSDDTFHQVMELTRAPVIASHSSCRHFTPGFERNMSDDMIRKLAKNGGVIQINFGSIFISEKCRLRFYEGRDKALQWAQENDIDPEHKSVREWRDHYFEEHPVGVADVTDVANHIDHVVQLVGVEHVGFGSDFDGVGDSLPTGLKDVSYFPNLIKELLARGYEEEDIEKICSGNLLRVWRDVERVASELSAR